MELKKSQKFLQFIYLNIIKGTPVYNIFINIFLSMIQYGIEAILTGLQIDQKIIGLIIKKCLNLFILLITTLIFVAFVMYGAHFFKYRGRPRITSLWVTILLYSYIVLMLGAGSFLTILYFLDGKTI